MGIRLEITNLQRQQKDTFLSEIRSFIKLELARTISEKYENADAIAGVATGAIAQGALVADLLGLPFVYIRSTPKIMDWKT